MSMEEMSGASQSPGAREKNAVVAARGPDAWDLTLAHSPDSDDAFMFYALATNKVRAPGLRFAHTLSDIESLNQAAHEEKYDVTALSFSAYPALASKYALLDCGSSFGDGYGPLVVASRALKPEDLGGRRIAVPGMLTTSYLALRLHTAQFEPVPIPFDKIIEAVRSDTVEAGLLIHEGQLLYSDAGLHRVLDLGSWWREQTGLPLPLGGNAVRRALGPEVGRRVGRALQESVQYALDHREPALTYAMQFARDMDYDLADKFVGMYVNSWTLSMGEIGRSAVRELLARGHHAGILPSLPSIDFISLVPGGSGD
ncbi:MAG TPA: MqnA/MqnD/SBP family protein [Candidatus Binatia bacterium]|nr:MqnA/MqnD/SBP family protein [Candidatus Binatia bacterium]